MPDPVPSSDEIVSLLHELAASRDRVLIACAGLDGAGWEKRDGAGRWTVAEVLEHLVLVERGLLKMEQKMLTEPPEADWAAALANDARLPLVDSGPEPIQAPDRVRPSGSIAREDLLVEFRGGRAALIAFAGQPGQALKAHTRPHLALGALNGYQWLVFVGHHARRHARQIERCLA